MSKSLAELAELTCSELQGDGSVAIDTVADIKQAAAGAIAFVSDLKYKRYIDTTQASALIVTADLAHVVADSCDKPCLVAEAPRLVYARIANILFPSEAIEPGISAQANIATTASISATACIEPGAVVMDGASVGDGSRIGANAVLEKGASVGHDTIIGANAVVGRDCKVGDGCILHAGCVLGADGFGFVRDTSGGKTENIKIPQTGRVVVGNDVEIGACTSIDRGALEDTVIGDGVKLDNQIQIAHSVRIGANTIISAATAIAGSTVIGEDCMIGGCTAIREHLEIADRVMITGRTLVTHSVTKPGSSVSSGTPMDDTVSWRKNSARFRQLDKMARRLTQLEKQLARLDDNNQEKNEE